jgi:amidase
MSDDRDDIVWTRRGLLGAAAGSAVAGTASLAAGPLLAQPGKPAPAALPAPHPGTRSFELAGISLAEMRRGLESGRWTARRLAELYLERIAAVDGGPAGTHALAETNPEALEIAGQLDAERRAGKVRGPLHGIPVVVKDNIDTADRMATTAGSLALVGTKPARDAHVVARLRAAGAVLLGKTNLSEWANFRSTRSSSGWSGRGGQVHNPHALDRNPCGSSSGSGVAPVADLTAAAVGTETDGSVICPASMCGLVGLKPTLGLVSRTGIIPIAHSQDTAGPMGRTVEDVAILLGGMTGTDITDPATAEAARYLRTDWTATLKPNALAGARIGVARNLFGWHPEVDRQMAGVLDTLERLGAELVDPAEVPHARDVDPTELAVLLYEFKHDLNAHLARLPDAGQPRTLAALIEWNLANADREMQWFGQEIFVQAEEKGPLTDDDYKKALETNRRLTREEGIDQVLGAEKLDALVCPTMGPAYPTDWLNGDHYSGSATSPSAVAGYPHLTVPGGFVHGLPWGVSFLGPAWSEAKLLGYGYAFEAATQARRAPTFLATLPLG